LKTSIENFGLTHFLKEFSMKRLLGNLVRRRVALGAFVGALGLLVLPGFASAAVISDWAALDGKTLTVDDKAFTLVDYSKGTGGNSDIGGVTFNLNSFFANSFTLTLGQTATGPGAFPSGTWNGFIDYNVQVTDPRFHFNSVSLDTQHVGTGVVVEKDITGPGILGTETLVSVNGSSVDAGLAGQLIHVHESFTVLVTGRLQTTDNTFTETPEPGSLVLLCTGLASFGGFGWFNKRKATVVA